MFKTTFSILISLIGFSLDFSLMFYFGLAMALVTGAAAGALDSFFPDFASPLDIFIFLFLLKILILLKKKQII
jgi:hypothetical protein